MSNNFERRLQAGMSLLELTIAIVVLGVGLAGLLTVFSQSARGSGDPLLRKQMLSIAEAMMEEIRLRPYAAVAPGPSAGCARVAFNDILDYNGYTQANVCDIDGNLLPHLNGYGVSVAVVASSLNGVPFPGPGAPALRISVTATHTSPGGTVESLTLVGYRTQWAVP